MSTDNLTSSNVVPSTSESVVPATTPSHTPTPVSKKTSKSQKPKKGHNKNKRVAKRGVVAVAGPSIRRPAIKRLARRGGVKRLSKDTYDEVRKALENYLQNVVKKALLMTHHDRRKTVQSADVMEALKLNNSPIYGI